MGLDVVELVLEVEAAFAVKLPDVEAERIRTVGELFDWILENISDKSKGSQCLSAATFYEIRKGFRQLDVDLPICPATPLIDRLPKSGRKRFWSRIEYNCDLEFPRLVRPSWVVAVGVAVTFVAAMFIGYKTYESTGSQFLALMAGISVLILVGFVISVVTRPLAYLPHRNWAEFRGLTEAVLARNFQRIKQRRSNWNETDLWVALRAIIVEQPGVRPSEVTREANFVKDPGIG